MYNLKVDEITAAVAPDDEPTIPSTFELKTITLGFLIPLSVLGLIIGKKGQRMKGDFTDVEILIQRYSDTPADSNERVVFITGNFKSVITAQEVMLNIVKMKRPNFDRINSDCNEVRVGENEVLFRGVITGRLTGLLIGKSGANIKAIHDATGCWVKIGHEEERIRGSKERQIYIQGPPESVAQARLLVAAKVPIHSVSSAITVEYYPISFPIAESLRNENNFFLKDVNIASGATVQLLSIDSMETGENVTHIVIEGKKEVNDIARNLLDNFINEWKSAHDSQSSNSDDTHDGQVVVRWCLPSELVSFLFTSIISIQYIQQVSDIILHVLSNRPSTSLTSQDTVLVMIGTLKGIVEAEEIILTKIFEIEEASPSLLQLKNKIFRTLELAEALPNNVDRTSVISTATATATPTITASPPLESSHPPNRSSNYPQARNEARTSSNESKRTHSTTTTRRLSSQGENKSPGRNQSAATVTAYSGLPPQDTSIMGGNLQHSVLYAESDESVDPLGSMLPSPRLSPSSSTYLVDTVNTTATEHKIQRNLSSERRATALQESKHVREVLEEKSTATPSRRRSSNTRAPVLPAQTLRAPALFQNAEGLLMPGGCNYNYPLQQQQQQLLQNEFFYRQEQERCQFLYWQALQQQQQQLSSASYTPYPYPYGLPSSSLTHHPHQQQYVPPSPFPYHVPNPHGLGEYSPHHSRQYQPSLPYRSYPYPPQSSGSSSLPPPPPAVPVPVPTSPLPLPREQPQPQHTAMPPISPSANPPTESTDNNSSVIEKK